MFARHGVDDQELSYKLVTFIEKSCVVFKSMDLWMKYIGVNKKGMETSYLAVRC